FAFSDDWARPRALQRPDGQQILEVILAAQADPRADLLQHLGVVLLVVVLGPLVDPGCVDHDALFSLSHAWALVVRLSTGAARAYYGRRSRLRRFAGGAVLALAGEELEPGTPLRVPLEQPPPLAFGHTAPDTELDLVV